jgi:hypothetical protein
MAEDEPFTATFSNGVKIELVGISIHPSHPWSWWTPDGMRMPQAPYAQSRSLLQPNERAFVREVCWRWTNVPPDGSLETKWQVVPEFRADVQVVPIDTEETRAGKLNAAVVMLEAADECTIRFSVNVASGPPTRTTVENEGSSERPTAAGPVETIEFRDVRLNLGDHDDVKIVRIAADGKEERLPEASGISKALIEQLRNSPELRENEERVKKERALLKNLAQEPAYRLRDGERFKHAPPPFSAARQEYWSHHGGGTISARGAAPAEPEPPRPGFMQFQWVHNDLDWKSGHLGPPTVGRVLDDVFNLKPHRIEGGVSLLSTELPGDWIVIWNPTGSFAGDSEEYYFPTAADVEALEGILQNELLEIVDLNLREVQRPVYVVKGTYKYTPVPGPDGRMREPRSDQPDEIKIIAGNRSASASYISRPELLERIGAFLNVPLVDESTTRSTKRQTFLRTYVPRSSDERMPLDQATIDAILASLTTQTGYTFTKEERPVKFLFIKRGFDDAR